MEIFPAIDLQNGQCVRLKQGDFAQATIYESDPLRMADKFTKAGATWLHVVDLDGARDGQSRQFDLIERIAKSTSLTLQVGGGIREKRDVERLLAAGATRVVIGSLAAKNQALVKEWIGKFGPQRIVIAFDVQTQNKAEPEVLLHGWQNGSNLSLWKLIDDYADSGLKTILCTDVSRDGMLQGTNDALYRSMQERYPAINLLASGGVSGLADVLELKKMGVAGAIVGKAIYEGRIDLADAIRQVRHAG